LDYTANAVICILEVVVLIVWKHEDLFLGVVTLIQSCRGLVDQIALGFNVDAAHPVMDLGLHRIMLH
jgi:hypothetical protein